MIEILGTSLIKIVNDLYDFSRQGVVLIPNAIPSYHIQQLQEELFDHKELFRPAPREYGIAEQEFNHFYLDEINEPEKTLPTLCTLQHGYRQWRNQFGATAKIECGKTTVAVNQYCRGAKGISAHRDELSYVNLIAVATITGEATLTVHHREEETKYQLKTGSLLLMRAPRSAQEKEYRPRHSLHSVLQERYAVIFREHKGF